MNEFTIQYRFALGSHVCLKAHCELPLEGRPQIGVVTKLTACIVDGQEGAYHGTPCYVIRWLGVPGRWTPLRQASAGEPEFLESELVAYDQSLDAASDKAITAANKAAKAAREASGE